jgi:hypothetical protein
MTTAILAALAAALVVSVLALSREVRLRKALEVLLQTILSRWRTHVSKMEHYNADQPDHSVDVD